MADKVSTERQAKITLGLQNGNDIVERSITFDTQLTEGQIKDGMLALKPKFVSDVAGTGVYHYMIQPSNWRDDDDEETAYACVSFEGEMIVKTTTKFDTSD